MEELQKAIDEEIKCISKQGLNKDNVETLKNLFDVKEKILMEEKGMRYDDYDGMRYSARRRGSNGRYMGNYRGHGDDMIGRMKESYHGYEMAKDEYMNGNYGAIDEKKEKLEIMLESAVDFINYIVDENDDPESKQMIEHYMRKLHV